MNVKNQNQPALTGSELSKGLEVLQRVASLPQNPRSAELFQKAQAGTLTGEEKDELMKSLSSDFPAQVTAPVRENETIRKSVDVSDYLRENNKALLDSLSLIAGHMQKSEGQEHEFRKALAQTVVEMHGTIKTQGALIKSLQDQVASFGAQPARAPKSNTAAAAAAPAQPLNKSFAGQGGGGDTLSKSQIEDAMSGMLEKGMSVVGGEDLLSASSKYEMFQTLSPGVLEAVKQFHLNTKAA